MSIDPQRILFVDCENKSEGDVEQKVNSYFCSHLVQYKCSKCQEDRECYKTFSFFSFPQVLVVNIKRQVTKHYCEFKKKWSSY